MPLAVRAEPAVLETRCAAPDQARLPELLAAQGFVPPAGFKAFVLDLGTEAAPRCKAYDYRGTSDDRDDWWPASTVKLYAAIAALEETGRLGFSPKVTLKFAYAEGEASERLIELIKHALIPSSNHAYDRLVELVGFDALHRKFFTARNGLPSTVLLRSYTGRIRDAETKNGLNRHSPAIALEEGARTHALPERTGALARECPDQGNCTTLAELSEALRRVMLHERLPKKERFELSPAALKLLRGALSSPRPRGMNIVDGLRAGFGSVQLETAHKPGYALEWMSDVVFVQRKDDGRRYIVALAGYPGREALDGASRAIGALLASGALEGSDAPVILPPAPAPAPSQPPPIIPPTTFTPRACQSAPEGMACIPGAEFAMGVDADTHTCDQPGNVDPQPTTTPSHRVQVDTFYMDRTEVTIAAYNACVARRACPKDGPGYQDFRAPQQAIVGLSWFSARTFCEAHGKRLPTEAEWELAARGPNGETHPWGNEPATCERAIIEDARGRSCGRAQRGNHPEAGRINEVGARPAGRYGLFDMAGNAEEWVADWWSKSYAACGAACTGLNPKGPCAGADKCPGHNRRVVRGGSWYWPGEHATGYHRRRHMPSNELRHHFGFRCAQSLK